MPTLLGLVMDSPLAEVFVIASTTTSIVMSFTTEVLGATSLLGAIPDPIAPTVVSIHDVVSAIPTPIVENVVIPSTAILQAMVGTANPNNPFEFQIE